nr:phosphoenolpyruvate carboxylase [Chromatium okenii]
MREQEDAELRDKLMKRIEGLDAQTLSEVIRAFTIYFGLVNTAEELNAHLVRMERIADGERRGSVPLMTRCASLPPMA